MDADAEAEAEAEAGADADRIAVADPARAERKRADVRMMLVRWIRPVDVLLFWF